jgi:hypothetical protein
LVPAWPRNRQRVLAGLTERQAVAERMVAVQSSQAATGQFREPRVMEPYRDFRAETVTGLG